MSGTGMREETKEGGHTGRRERSDPRQGLPCSETQDCVRLELLQGEEELGPKTAT